MFSRNHAWERDQLIFSTRPIPLLWQEGMGRACTVPGKLIHGRRQSHGRLTQDSESTALSEPPQLTVYQRDEHA